jgi:hypothetical protein
MPMPDAPRQPRDLGNTAAMHVYWYAPKTLEITHVETYLFKDVNACEGALNKAMAIAVPTAGEGDMVAAKCVGIHPPRRPEQEPLEPGSNL